MRRFVGRATVRVLFAAVVVAAVAVGVVATTASGAGTAGGGTVIYRLDGDWTDFDIQRTSIGAQNRVSRLVYEGMLAYAPDRNGKTRIVGHLASSWRVTPRSITFKLRNGPRCADGTPVTPALVVRSWRRMLRVSTTLNLAFGGTQGGGGKPATGVGPFAVSSNARAGTVTFRASKPNSELIYGFLGPYGGLAGGAARVVCPAGLSNPNRLKTQMFGTGPYEVVSARHLDQAVLRLRRNYTWGPNGVRATARNMPDTIVFKVVPNSTTAANLFLTGQLDVGEDMPAADRDRLVASGRYKIVRETSKMTTHYLAFNNRKPTLQDVNLRTALIMSISPQTYQLAVNGRNSGSILNHQFSTPSASCHNASLRSLVPRGTLEAARALLTRNGYTYRDNRLFKPDGEPLALEFLGTPTETGPGGEYVVDQWQKLGVDAKLTNLESSIWGGRIYVGNYDVTVLGFTSDYPSAGAGIGWLSGPYPPNGNNLGVPRNAAYEREITLAKQTLGATSCRHWNNAARMLLRNRWFFPMYANARANVLHEDIRFQKWNGEIQMLTYRLSKPIRR
jgi:peptide/nickel transport system substrate-binding protein